MDDVIIYGCESCIVLAHDEVHVVNVVNEWALMWMMLLHLHVNQKADAGQ